MTKRVFVCGSLAFDVLMNFAGNFTDHILPGSLDNLSVSFLAQNRHKCFGGCGGNIAYGLCKFDVKPLLFGVAGQDFREYLSHLQSSGVDTKGVVLHDELPTASAFILSDEKANQIAMFSPGAMNADFLPVNIEGNFDFAILGPFLPEKMVEVAQSLSSAGIKYLFDPGQALVALNREQIEDLIAGANGMILNEYEVKLLEGKLGRSLEDIRHYFDYLVVTLGENGSEVYIEDAKYNADAVRDLQILDATGCGDSFRAGFIAALLKGEDYEVALRWGNVAASFCLETIGGQAYDFTSEEFVRRYQETYL